jgi:hypothetical protein
LPLYDTSFCPKASAFVENREGHKCLLPGAELAFEAAINAYQAQNSIEKLKIHVTPNETYCIILEPVEMTIGRISR